MLSMPDSRKTCSVIDLKQQEDINFINARQQEDM